MTSQPFLPVPGPTPWVYDIKRNPPVYTRPLVGSELLMHRVWAAFDGACETCFGINFTSSLKEEELKDRTRNAVDKLRFVCPIIACTIEDTTSPRWVYTPSADREAWLDLSFDVVERGESLSPSEFIQHTNLKRLPYTDGNGSTTFLKTYLLTTSKGSHDGTKQYGLYFHGSHSIIDAGPALHALNLMCEWICGEGMDVRTEGLEEWKNLPVDPIAAIGAPSKELWETAGMKLMQELAELNARVVPRHTLPSPTRPSNNSLPLFRYTISASEPETAAIIAETKKLGVSVSALFHAAFCLAQIKMNPIPEGAEFDFPSDSTIVSLEPYMKPPVNPKTHFISSFTMMSLRFPLGQVLMEQSEKGRLIMMARKLQERFDENLANPCLPHLYAVVATLVADNLTQRTTDTKSADPAKVKEVKKGVPTTWSSSFNNLGVMERRLQTQHGMLSVDSIGIGTRQRTTMAVHMWTMHSQLHFHVQGDNIWEEESIKTLVEEMRRIGLLILDDAANARKDT